MLVDEYIGRVVEFYSSGSFYEEAKRAKQEFFMVSGEVAEGSDQFEPKMNSFLDWYVFDRPLTGQELAPIKAFVLDSKDKLSPEEISIYRELATSRNSMFELLKTKGSDMYVKDLFDGEKYVIENFDLAGGFTKGDVFQARLLKIENLHVFNNAFVFHPAEAKAFIAKQIKKVRYLKDSHRTKLLHTLSAMKLKTEQYAHIDVKHIYSEEPVL